jgi:hypothetical protein
MADLLAIAAPPQDFQNARGPFPGEAEADYSITAARD